MMLVAPIDTRPGGYGGKVDCYLRSRMDIDARLAMSHFRDHARNQGNTQFQQFVRNTIFADCLNGGIAENNFTVALGGGVTVVGIYRP